jgi:hypothetical protein
MGFFEALVVTLAFINSFGEEVEFHVSENGKDEGNCSEAESCKTIWYAYKQSNLNDILKIKPGIYISIENIIIHHGINIHGLNKEDVVIAPGLEVVVYLFSLKSDVDFFIFNLTLVLAPNITTIVIGEGIEKTTIIMKHILFVSNNSLVISGAFISGIGSTNNCSLYGCELFEVISSRFFLY